MGGCEEGGRGSRRSRLVAKESNTCNGPELFAATLPVESLKDMLRRAVQKRDKYIMHVVATRAYFYANISRDIYVKLPTQDMQPGDEEKCGKLLKAMYGTRARDSSRVWLRHGKGVPVPLRSERLGRVWHRSWRRICVRGGRAHLEHISKHRCAKFRIKVAMAGRHSPVDIRALNRSIKWTVQGKEYENDHRHTDRLMEEMELRPGQTVVSPAVCESRKGRKKDDGNMKSEGTAGGVKSPSSAGQTGAGREDARATMRRSTTST